MIQNIYLYRKNIYVTLWTMSAKCWALCISSTVLSSARVSPSPCCPPSTFALWTTLPTDTWHVTHGPGWPVHTHKRRKQISKKKILINASTQNYMLSFNLCFIFSFYVYWHQLAAPARQYPSKWGEPSCMLNLLWTPMRLFHLRALSWCTFQFLKCISRIEETFWGAKYCMRHKKDVKPNHKIC